MALTLSHTDGPIKIEDISSWDRDDNVGYHCERTERSEHYRHLRSHVVYDTLGYWHTVCPGCRRPDLSHKTKCWYRSDAEAEQRRREADHRVCARCLDDAGRIRLELTQTGPKTVQVILDGPGDPLSVIRSALRRAGHLTN
jgi:hypothetical protein